MNTGIILAHLLPLQKREKSPQGAHGLCRSLLTDPFQLSVDQVLDQITYRCRGQFQLLLPAILQKQASLQVVYLDCGPGQPQLRGEIIGISAKQLLLLNHGGFTRPPAAGTFSP